MPTSTAGTRGATAVEFAIVLPVLLMFVLGLLDCGRLLWSYTTLAHAVEAATRCAVVNSTTCGTAAAIESYAASQAWGLGLSSAAFTATAAACGTKVNGTFAFTFVIPWFYGTAPFGASNAMTLTAMACYPV
jgi:Flp pilus assembly protein TadG